MSTDYDCVYVINIYIYISKIEKHRNEESAVFLCYVVSFNIFTNFIYIFSRITIIGTITSLFTYN